MSPRTEKQFEAIREEKRQRILDAALDIFGNEGYQSSSISKVAKKAGISKGLVYNYFESKEVLVRELINQGIEEMMINLDPNRDGILNPRELEYFINEMCNHLKNNKEFWKLYFSITLQPAIYPLVKEKIDELAQPVMSMAVNYFKNQGFEDPQAETMIFGALLDGIGFHYIMDSENYPLEEVKQTLIERYVKPSKNQ